MTLPTLATADWTTMGTWLKDSQWLCPGPSGSLLLGPSLDVLDQWEFPSQNNESENVE